MDAAPPSWAGAKRPEIKRTYQSKFSKAGKSSSLAQTLLDRAVWAYDALFAAAPPKPKLRLSKSSAGPPPDENTDPRVSGAAAEDVMASFSRLSLCREPPASPMPTVSPQSVSMDVCAPMAPVAATPSPPSSAPASPSPLPSPIPVHSPAASAISSPSPMPSPIASAAANPAPPLPVALPSLPSSPAPSFTDLPLPALKSIMSFLSTPDIVGALTLTKTLSRVAVNALSLQACSHEGAAGRKMRSPASTAAAYPWGCFLSDGAFKKVYKVWSRASSRCEAVSVMNIADIASTGNEHVIHQEIRMGCLASELVMHGVCANFIAIYAIFQCCGGVDEAAWGSGENKAPHGVSPPPAVLAGGALPKAKARGKKRVCSDPHLFIAMELCDRGSAEDMLRVIDSDVWEWERGGCVGPDPAGASLIPYLFQMAISLSLTASRLHMLHADVKLLNFMLTHNTNHTLTYGADVCGRALTFPCDVIVKLGDFGTSAILPKTHKQTITLKSFTTFENTPPEYLYGGDSVVEDFSADAWCLGLCMFHLFTGCCPYEEVMAAVLCPDSLISDLNKAWRGRNYTTLSQALACDDDNTLAHTLYRCVVLLGLPGAEELRAAGCVDNPVWAALTAACSPPKRKGAKAGAFTQYTRDAAACSLATGTHPLVVRCRRRLASLPHSEALLRGLLSFFPHARPSLLSLPTHTLFQAL